MKYVNRRACERNLGACYILMGEGGVPSSSFWKQEIESDLILRAP